MKTNFIFLFIIIPFFALAQVGIGTTNPQGTLDITTDSTANPTNADGLLIPRVALSATNTATVLTPTESELVYNTATQNDVAPGYYYWSGSVWIRLATGNLATTWSTTGNSGTNPINNFLGTSDATDLVVQTNATERLRITKNGVLGLNAATPGSLGGSLGSSLLEMRSNTGGSSDLNISLFDSNGFPALNFGYARGTELAPTAVQNGDSLFDISANGYDGSSFRNMGGIKMQTDGVASTTSMPSRISFFTAPSGSVTPLERLSIINSGNVGIATTSPDTLLQVGSYGDTRNNAITVATAGGAYQSAINLRAYTKNFGFSLVSNDPTNSFMINRHYSGNPVVTDFLISKYGFIGIGNISPYYKLDVTGDLRSTSSAYFASTTGNVGVGTLIPEGKLDVSGTFRSNLTYGNFRTYDYPPYLSTVLVGGFNGTSGNKPQVRWAYDTSTSFFDEGLNTDGNFVIQSNDVDSFVVTTGQNVGIGTSTPTQAKLVVNGTASTTLAYGYLNDTGLTGIDTGTFNYSIYASGRIAATQFNAFSDVRIKNVLSRSNSKEDLATLSKIQITNYKYIDTIANSNNEIKKVIAQEVAKVYPQAVSMLTDAIPDIYKQANLINGLVVLENNLKVGEKVKIIFATGEKLVEVLEATSTSFKINSNQTEHVFVYGREVTDFHTVDYEALSTLTISATQELLKRIVLLEKENETLKTQFNILIELKSDVNALKQGKRF